jgi:uncharacterized membrane protein
VAFSRPKKSINCFKHHQIKTGRLLSISDFTWAHVSALRETSVVIAALIGTVVLGEPGAVARIAAAAVVAAGVIVMNWRS